MYAFTVRNPYYIKDIELLERIQRKVTKIPGKLKHVPYPERLIGFNFTTLREWRHRSDLIETYKITTGYYQCKVTDLFHLSQILHIRGHTYNNNNIYLSFKNLSAILNQSIPSSEFTGGYQMDLPDLISSSSFCSSCNFVSFSVDRLEIARRSVICRWSSVSMCDL